MKNSSRLFITILTVSAILCSCSKDGTVGPAGAAGQPGAAGAVGPKGDPGTANVIYSDWYTPAAYSKSTVFGTTVFTADIAASKITQEAIDKGSVLVYGKLNGYNATIWPTGQVSQLPVAINYMVGSTPTLDTWSGLCTPGKVRITLTNSTNQYINISTAHQFRYIIIPGGVQTLGAVNPKNYHQVMKALGINN
jgi:hypothetical protein